MFSLSVTSTDKRVLNHTFQKKKKSFVILVALRGEALLLPCFCLLKMQDLQQRLFGELNMLLTFYMTFICNVKIRK